jgi:aminoglycoside phosphotransferase
MALPHGYTNETASDGAVVTKRYVGPDGPARLERESAALAALDGLLPVPRILGASGGPPVLRLASVAGRHGQDLVDEGRGASVLAACGRLLRLLQAVPPDALPGLPGHGPVIVHGDFGPQNLLLAEDASTPVALLDWEFVHLGVPVEDLAWAEWIVRMHHASAVEDLGALFDHYGTRPPWAARHEAMVVACEAQRARAERTGTPSDVRHWTRRVRLTERFSER